METIALENGRTVGQSIYAPLPATGKLTLCDLPRLLAALLGEQAEAGGFPVELGRLGATTWVEHRPSRPIANAHPAQFLTDETFTANRWD